MPEATDTFQAPRPSLPESEHPSERVLEATPVRAEVHERELQELRQANAKLNEANAKLTARLEERSTRLEEAEQEISQLAAEKLRAEHEVSFLKTSLSDEKAKAQKSGVENHHSSNTDCRGLEDQIGSLTVRYNTLKKQYDAKGTEARELQKQLDLKSKELDEKDGKVEERENKLQESLKENRNIRQKMANWAKDAQITDAEHRRMTSAGRLNTPGEFARMMKSSENRNNMSQENASLISRNIELEAESQLDNKVLSRLREKGLGNVIDEVWHEVSACEELEDITWTRAP